MTRYKVFIMGLREEWKTLLVALVSLAIAAYLTYSSVDSIIEGNELNYKGEIANGWITDTMEDWDETDYGQSVVSHGVTYEFRLPSGQIIEGSYYDRGTIDNDSRLYQEGHTINWNAVEVEYLPNNPSVSRIKGSDDDTLAELIRHETEHIFITLIPLAIGVYLLVTSIRDVREITRGP